MVDQRLGMFRDGSTTVPAGTERTKERVTVSCTAGGLSRFTSAKRKSPRVGKLEDKSSYCPGDKSLVNSFTRVGIETCTRHQRRNRDLSFVASWKLSRMTSDQLISGRSPDDTNLYRRGMHRPSSVLSYFGHCCVASVIMTRAGPNRDLTWMDGQLTLE